jgi:hypothetical protein
MATPREWIVALSHFVFNTAPLNIISWPSPRVMRLKDLKIDIDQFLSKVKSTFQALHVHVREKVLFGIPAAFKLLTANSQDKQTHRYSPFGPSDKSLRNVDSAAFLGTLLKDGKLCYRGCGDIIVWDRRWVNQWLADIDRSWSDVYCLMHTEGRHHLFVINYIMALINNYHKGHQTTGLYKQILRLMPNKLAYVMAILLRVVRPIEATVVRMFFTPENEKSAMKKKYCTRIFVTSGREWDSRRLSALLKAWWQENMGLPIAMNLHRQFAMGMQ